MKKIILGFLVIILVIPACRYEDGPLISFRSVKERIEGTWQVVGLSSNNIDSLQNFNDSCGANMQIYYQYAEGFGILFQTPDIATKSSIEGSFSFSDDKKIMNVEFGYSIFTYHLGPLGSMRESNWKILELKMKRLIVTTDYDGRHYRFTFDKI